MKKKILLLFALVATLTIKAADKEFYQSILQAQIDTFMLGYADKAAFDKSLQELSNLEKAVISEPQHIAGKDALLGDIQSVYAFIGELSPDTKNYNLLHTQKKKAMQLLAVTDTILQDPNWCLPISKITLWGDKYTCYMIENKSDSMMYLYKFDYSAQRKYSSRTGSIDGAVSKNTSHALYSEYINDPNIKFKQTKCDKQLQIVTYIKQEAITPKVEKYPEPNYLTPAQQKAKKEKEAEKAKKEAQKEKEKTKKEKEKSKKEADKAKEQAKKDADKAKEQAKKEAQKSKEEAADSKKNSKSESTYRNPQ